MRADNNIESSLALSNKKIAVPETRELDVLAGLFERRGAEVLRFPLISIYDTPDTKAVKKWIETFIAQPPEWLILFTGEGVRRLLTFVERHKLSQKNFLAALTQCKIISRGPKPARELRKLNIEATLLAESPTTDGVIASLQQIELTDVNVSVQLYGSNPNLKLMDYLNSRSAQVNCVSPYIYAASDDKKKVFELLELIDSGKLDVVAFTSQSQVEYLFKVATKNNKEEILKKGLNNLIVAAVGPIVAKELTKNNVIVTVMPSVRFFMKPLVTEIVDLFKNKQ